MEKLQDSKEVCHFKEAQRINRRSGRRENNAIKEKREEPRGKKEKKTDATTQDRTLFRGGIREGI